MGEGESTGDYSSIPTETHRRIVLLLSDAAEDDETGTGPIMQAGRPGGADEIGFGRGGVGGVDTTFAFGRKGSVA
jgi:hypothetical protein